MRCSRPKIQRRCARHSTTLKPNRELRPLYEAAVARQQADQIFNLSLTRTATKTLLRDGCKGVIGIGRVKTPTLAIVCLRELEIRDFRRRTISRSSRPPRSRTAVHHATCAAGQARITRSGREDRSAAAESTQGRSPLRSSIVAKRRRGCSICRRCRRPAVSAGDGTPTGRWPWRRNCMTARARSSSPIRARRRVIWPRTRSPTCRRSCRRCCGCADLRNSKSIRR